MNSSLIIKNVFAFVLFIIGYQNLDAQNINITDTINNGSGQIKLNSDSAFIVEGEIIGMDSGSIKAMKSDQSIIACIPFKNGKFSFSGYVNALEFLNLQIKGDYYNMSFYMEPGLIKIKWVFHGDFTASGTKENDLSNYFHKTVNKSNSDRFWELNNKVDAALKEEDIELYLKLIDSFGIVENDFFRKVNEAILQKKWGDYLLSCINYYDISYGYFAERKAIFDQLPDNLKNSAHGKDALAYLEFTKTKNTPHSNVPAYQFTLNDINKKAFALKKFEGKIIVLDFWASWCLPCIKALPMLKKIQTKELSKDVVYISISIDKKENDWKAKDMKLAIPWLSLLADEETIKQYEVNAVPSYIVINEAGKIVSKSSSLANLYSTLLKFKK